jgi:Carboxypeptidase regulatory-like domain
MCMRSIKIIIPTPCSVSLDAMSKTDEGRFCTSCMTSVTDFTNWDDQALYKFFTKNDRPICGTFLATQLDRPLHIPYQPHSRLYRLTAALGLSLIFLPNPQLQAQTRAPRLAQTHTTKHAPKSGTNQKGISGRVTDTKKNPVAGAFVQLMSDNVPKAQAFADSKGNYKIPSVSPGVYDIVVTDPGHNTVTQNNVTIAADKLVELNFTMVCIPDKGSRLSGKVAPPRKK